jgi:hypothetical protein
MFLVDDVHKWWLGYDVTAQRRRGAAPMGNRFAKGVGKNGQPTR